MSNELPSPDDTNPPRECIVVEHPYLVRLTHWIAAIATAVMTLSGLAIFRAFPSFGDKVPENALVNVPEWIGLGGWLGGALQWHLTFMWLFLGAGIVYAVFQVSSGNYRQVLFNREDVSGLLPMVLYYARMGPKPMLRQTYNPLQKLAYTSALLAGAMLALTGLVLYKPVQLSPLAWVMGGFGMVRLWHFLAMAVLLDFIPGHLVMVALHGFNNFYSMCVGWKCVSHDNSQ